MCKKNLTKTYGEIMNPLEIEILEQVLAENSPDNRAYALQQVLYKNIDSIKTYDEFKEFIFGYIGYVRKTTLNTNPTKQLFEKIKIMLPYYENKRQEQIIKYLDILEEEILKDWENLIFGIKNNFANEINGPVAEKTQHILDQKV